MVTVIGILGASGIAPSTVLQSTRRHADVVVAAVASRRGGRAYAERFGIERAYDAGASRSSVEPELPGRRSPLELGPQLVGDLHRGQLERLVDPLR